MPLDRTRVRALCFDVDGTLADELLGAGAHLILRTTSDLLGVLEPAEDPIHERTASPEPKA